MNSRQQMLQEQRQNATPEERQAMALEGIHDMLPPIISALSSLERAASSLSDNVGQITSIMKKSNFGQK